MTNPIDEANPSGIFEKMFRQPIIILLVGLLFVSIGIILEFTHHHEPMKHLPYFYTLSRELGFAFIIAYLVAMCIERVSRDRHDAHVKTQLAIIQRDVFEAAYGRRQNPSLIKSLEKEIFLRSFFRTHYDVTISLGYMDSDIGEKMLKVDMHVTFRLHNMTSTDADTHFAAAIEIPYDRRLAKEATMKSLSIGGVQLTPDQLKKANDLELDTPDFKRYRWPLSIRANSFVEVDARYTMVKYPRDYMVWKVTDPCDGFALTVFHPKDIVIFGATIHSADGKKYGGGLEDDTFGIQIEEPLYPHNGVQFWWSRADEVRNLQGASELTDQSLPQPEGAITTKDEKGAAITKM